MIPRTVSEYPDCGILQSAPLDARIIGHAQQQGIVMIVKKAIMAIGAIKSVILAVLKSTAIEQVVNVHHAKKGFGA